MKIKKIGRSASRTVVNGEMSLRRLKLSIYEVVTPREEEAIYPVCGSRDGVVGIATHYGLEGPGIESRWGAKFSAPIQNGCDAHPASGTMGTGSFPG